MLRAARQGGAIKYFLFSHFVFSVISKVKPYSNSDQPSATFYFYDLKSFAHKQEILYAHSRHLAVKCFNISIFLLTFLYLSIFFAFFLHGTFPGMQNLSGYYYRNPSQILQIMHLEFLSHTLTVITFITVQSQLIPRLTTVYSLDSSWQVAICIWSHADYSVSHPSWRVQEQDLQSEHNNQSSLTNGLRIQYVKLRLHDSDLGHACPANVGHVQPCDMSICLAGKFHLSQEK